MDLKDKENRAINNLAVFLGAMGIFPLFSIMIFLLFAGESTIFPVFLIMGPIVSVLSIILGAVIHAKVTSSAVSLFLKICIYISIFSLIIILVFFFFVLPYLYS
jgi:hypothetical protein